MVKIVATDTKIEIVPPRAERRRHVAEQRRQARYAKSGHVDGVRHAQPVVRGRFDENGKPLGRRFTADDLHRRAVARQQQRFRFVEAMAESGAVTKHEASRLLDTRAPHANRSTAERKHFSRKTGDERRRVDYLVGLANNSVGLHANGKEPFPLRYMNRGERLREIARREAEVVDLPMAA